MNVEKYRDNVILTITLENIYKKRNNNGYDMFYQINCL